MCIRDRRRKKKPTATAGTANAAAAGAEWDEEEAALRIVSHPGALTVERLEPATRTQRAMFREWAEQRLSEPAWEEFQCEDESWGRPWEVRYRLGVDLEDYKEEGAHVQLGLHCGDGSLHRWQDGDGFRPAHDNGSLRLPIASPLARQLQTAWTKEQRCIVTVVRPPGEAEAERIVSCEVCLLYTSPSPRDKRQSRMPSSA